MQIHTTQGEGHILIFLTGQDEIEKACEMLHKELHAFEQDQQFNPSNRDQTWRHQELRIMPLYSALSAEVCFFFNFLPH